MQTIWDLLPASLWPTQPFVPPPDPTQPSWTPSASDQSSFGWPATPGGPADVAPDPAASVSPWDSAMRQALAARAGPPRDPDMRDMAHYDRMLEDAKRAHDFVRWVLGPPSLPQASQTRDAALGGVSLQDGGDAARNAVATGSDARTILAENSAAPVAASQMPPQGSDDASNSAAPPSGPAGATYNPLTWTATDNPLSWIQRQYEREHPERAAAMKRMADTRLGDVPAIDSPIIRRRMADGFAYGFSDEPIIQHQNIGPNTRITAGGYELPDWAQPDARFLMRTANVVPQVLDLGLRSLRGVPPALAGFGAGLYQELGGSEAEANHVQQDLGVLAQFPLTDLSLVRPMAPAPRAPVRALEPKPLDIARKAPLAESEASASVPRPSAGPKTALDFGAPPYTREQAGLIRNWLGIEPERFRGRVGLDPPTLDGELLDERGASLGDIHRSILPDTGVAEHGYLGVNDELQNTGFVKNLLRSNVDYYRQRGLSQVNVNAGLDRGGYAWARYGFVPTQESWDELRPVLRAKVSESTLNLAAADRQAVLDLLERSDPQTIWRIADSRIPVVVDGQPLMFRGEPVPLGNHLLSGESWKGSLNLKDASTLRRFYNYVGSNR